ncbi:helix-turn-helix domain-containing protein [Hathewaya histolytica]|uniref:helix-turn-helix domain-containing protein n=1 Tax=Hathewaya histolytica TaxID=1498 RepID=UPI003B677C94
MYKINSKKVIELRLKKCLTGEEASEKIGISRATLYRIENENTKMPNAETLRKLTKYYGVEVLDILEDL